MALALLAGGAVALIYMLPVMLLAPMWSSRKKGHSWMAWYGAVLLSTAIATGLWGAWLVVAGESIMLDWKQAIQSGLVMQPLALFYEHGAWWWYLFLIPFVFFPWSVWPLGWMRLWHVRSEELDSGIVMCMIWSIPAIVMLSLLPVRQPQLLLPLFPAYAMVLVRLLLHEDLRAQGEDSFFAGMTFPVIAIGGLLAILPGLPRVPFLPELLWELSPFIGVAVAALGIAFSWAPAMNIGTRIGSIAVTTMFAVVAGSFAVGYQFGDRYYSHQLNGLLYQAEEEGKAIAQIGAYNGELHYNARLRRPIVELNQEDLLTWVAGHPDGLILTYSDRWQPANYMNMTPLLETPYGSATLRVWDALTVAAQG
jgi:4-amino-4-deoxy-L-arabinose transferase-like glycosyltransferase